MSLIQAIIYSTLFLYASGAVLYLIGFNKSYADAIKTAFVLSSAGFALNLLALILRTVIAARLPLSSDYEFLLVFTCITVFLFLVYEVRQGITGAGGAVMITAAMLILSVIMMMEGKFEDVSYLIPALKSPWLTIHVLTAAVAYASFTLAAALAVIQLIKTDTIIPEENIYWIITPGFILLSLSIIIGAIWAEQVWGSYWSWDPKEVWALVTWIVYAVYLHIRNMKEWRGKNTSIFVIAGFILVLFTLFGVNNLLPGLHSYAGRI
ncbi:MAG: cytochrome c biogenesis protein CcsA [Syntrophomonas sp.]|nr:cytochrome c biogenesis protein CcsA [Syntrophomonas sp.]